MLSGLTLGAIGASGGSVRDGKASGLLEFGICGKDDGGIRGSCNAGAALGIAGEVDPGRVNVGLEFFGVIDGTARSGSAGAGLGAAVGTAFFGNSGSGPFGVEPCSTSFGITSGGNPRDRSQLGSCGVSVITVGTSIFFAGVVGAVTASFAPTGTIDSAFGGTGAGFVVPFPVSGGRSGVGGNVVDKVPTDLPGMAIAGDTG
jgi:hypothetical protein